MPTRTTGTLATTSVLRTRPGRILLADGSVRVISFDIDRQMFDWLGDRRDGNPIGDF